MKPEAALINHILNIFSNELYKVRRTDASDERKKLALTTIGILEIIVTKHQEYFEQVIKDNICVDGDCGDGIMVLRGMLEVAQEVLEPYKKESAEA
jgi:hypothetical protein